MQEDNRKYNWETSELSIRPEYNIIADWILPGARVIDLGCGNGSLLRFLKTKKSAIGAGVELAQTGVDICRRIGLDVSQGSIDTHLSDISDGIYDYAICNVTIQMLMRPEVLLVEMGRISKYQIVSFPNFGFFLQRLELLVMGRMPRRLLYGYSWYNTGHIHQASVKDFIQTVKSLNFEICESAFLFGRNRMPNILPNLFATCGIFLLRYKG